MEEDRRQGGGGGATNTESVGVTSTEDEVTDNVTIS